MSATLEQDALDLVRRLRELLLELPSHHPFQSDEALLEELRGEFPVAPEMWDYFVAMSEEEANSEIESAGSCDECGAPITMVRAFEKLYVDIEAGERCGWERAGELDWYEVICENGHNRGC